MRHHRLVWGAIAMALALGVYGAGAQALSIPVTPAGDAFVTAGAGGSLGGNNYGGAGALAISGSGTAKGEFQTMLRFDVGAVLTAFDQEFGAGGWSVTSASLQLSAARPNHSIFNANSGGRFSASWVSDDAWSQGSGTPNSPGTAGLRYNSLQAVLASGPTEPLGTFNYNGADSGPSVYSLAISPGLAADVASGAVLSLHLFAADSTMSYLMNSGNYTVPGNRPLLTLTAVPEPGSVGLILLAGAMLLGRRIRLFQR